MSMASLDWLDLRSVLLGLLPLAFLFAYTRWFFIPTDERAVKFAWTRPREIECVATVAAAGIPNS